MKKRDVVKGDIELTVCDNKVLIWKANCPLSEVEHEQLSAKLRFEHEQSGVKIVLVPYSVTVEVPEGEAVEKGSEIDAATGGEVDDK